MRELPAYRRAARTVACPHCEAAAGAPCRRANGRATYEHNARYAHTRAAQNIGYEEGLRDALTMLDWKGGEGDPDTVALVRQPVQEQHDMVQRHNRRKESDLSTPSGIPTPGDPA